MRDFTIDLVWAKLQLAFSAIGGWLGYFLGGVDGLMTALIIFMVTDYVTGLIYKLWYSNQLDFWCINGMMRTNLAAIKAYLERSGRTEMEAPTEH